MDCSHIVRDRHTGTGLVGTLGLLRASRSSSFRRHPSKFSDLHVGDSQPADRLAIGHTNRVVCHSALCSPPCTADLTLSYPSCRPLCSSKSVSQPRGGVLQTASTLSCPMTAPFICALLTSSRLYNLSRLERKAIERYICESLTSRLIYPSSSPVGAGFFFVKKKDGTLRPCIDYRRLSVLLLLQALHL